MNSIKALSIVFFTLFMMGSCVSKKKLNEANAALANQKSLLRACEETTKNLQSTIDDLNAKLIASNKNLSVAQNELTLANAKLKGLEDQVVLLKSNSTVLMDQLTALSVVNKSGAESIKMSLSAISQQSQYIKDLTQSMQYKDSVNLALALNLKKTLSDFNDSDVNIEVKKGVVYISLSDKMLFKSGSAKINASAENVLAKIAGILNDQSSIDIIVEGHTDNVPMSTECVEDNWDLSTKRATAVVRTLQNKYKVAPSRMTAGGRSEFVPKSGNDSSSGRAENRRTEIIILPKLDEFFKLNESVVPAGK